MTTKREELIRRNEKFIQFPMPNLSEMKVEELERRLDFFEKSFELLFDEKDCNDENL